jgi:hypothetical protein
VPASSPLSQSDRDSPAASAKSRSHKLEAKGLLIVAVIILIITLVRYWHNFAWSAR